MSMEFRPSSDFRTVIIAVQVTGGQSVEDLQKLATIKISAQDSYVVLLQGNDTCTQRRNSLLLISSWNQL